jgi:hypothetical protein
MKLAEIVVAKVLEHITEKICFVEIINPVLPFVCLSFCPSPIVHYFST